MQTLARRSHENAASDLDEALRVVREKADQVRFGTITLTIHDGRLTQLEVSEKRRFGP